MNIAFLINSLHNAGGTERVSTVIANKLSEEGYCVKFFSLHRGEKPFFDISPKIDICYLNDVPYSNIYVNYLSNMLKIRKLCKINKIDYLIDVCTAMSLMSIPATIFSHTKVISWEHFNAGINWNPITSPLSRRLVSRFAYKVVVLTNDDKRIFDSKFKAKNTVVIHNPLTINPSGVVDIGQKVAIAVGRLEHQKGFDILLYAWSKTKCRAKGWKLRIVGSGSLDSELRDLSLSLGIADSVEFLPATNNIVSEYLKASVFLLSSRFEGFGLVLVEAMSVGLPIISFDCDNGPRDIVEHNTTGILVSPLDIESFSNEIDTLSSDYNLRCELSKNALYSVERFKLEPILQQWKNILEKEVE